MMDSSASVVSAAKGGFWIRLVAYIIDAIILGIVSGIIQAIFGQGAVASVLGIIIGLAYVVYFWTTSGATPGKMAMGLRVVSTDGSPLTVGKAVIRYVGYFVSGIVILIGFIWIAFDANKQGWHDKIAGTYVIKTR
jgi:uncharacterized RDD family membrane protein YckC